MGYVRRSGVLRNGRLFLYTFDRWILMIDISKLSPVEAARRIHNSSDLNFAPKHFKKGSRQMEQYIDELLRLTTEQVVRK